MELLFKLFYFLIMQVTWEICHGCTKNLLMRNYERVRCRYSLFFLLQSGTRCFNLVNHVQKYVIPDWNKKNLKQVIKPQKVVKNSLIKKQKKHTDSHALPTSQFVIWSGSVRQKKSCSIFNNRFLLNIIILKKRCKVLCKKSVCTGI